MKTTLGKAIVFGNIGESHAPSKQIDYNGLLKVLHSAFLVVASSFVSYLITSLPGLNFLPDSSTDELIITMFVIPLLELALTWLPSYDK